MTIRYFRIALFAVALVVALPLPGRGGSASCRPALNACLASAGYKSRGCRSECRRFTERAQRLVCVQDCRSERDGAAAACRHIGERCAAACRAGEDESACTSRMRDCRAAARRANDACLALCSAQGRSDRGICVGRCSTARAAADGSCGFVAVTARAGDPVLADLPAGAAADLSLLEPAERDVVAAADARVDGLRNSPCASPSVSPTPK